MASLSAAISFCPQALARPKRHSRNPNPNPNPNHRPKLKSRSSGHKFRPPPDAATTYTRLPPRDDFFSSSLDPSLRVSDEVNLSDAIAALDPPPAAITGETDHHRCRPVDDSSTSSEDEVADYTEVEGYEISRDVFEGNAELNGDADEEEEEEECGVKQKEKRVPAVMRCFDRTKIFVKAGDGGNGVVAFRREKFVPFGGPSGGNGGRGGNVVAEVDEAMNSLLPFRKGIHFRAGKGGNGHGRMQNGAKGEDVVVKVAPGTVIRATQEDGTVGEVVLELLHPGQRALLLPGGRGGRGNASFKTGTNKVPRIAENGEEGPEMWLELELKLVADVGIVGAPNAGKSTLLSVVSAAQPTIANYPFTTLLPNLGVVSFDYNSTMVVADLPGLLEGAHWGFGLGHEFLRHTERCSVLVHVVDGSTLHPEYEFDAVRLELELFNPELAEKPCVIAFNKMDLPEACEKWLSFKEMLQARGIVPLCMSALKREGAYEVISAAYELLKKKKKTAKDYKGWTDPLDLNHIADMVNEQRKISMSEFEICHETSSNTWQVTGYGLERFVQMTNWNYEDSMKRFERALEACGVNKTLIKRGVKEGDTVIVGEFEMVWHDDPRDISDRSKRKKQYADSIRWPEWRR